MIPFIIGAGVGYVVALLTEKESKPITTTKDAHNFYVYIRADDFGKGTMLFHTYEDARNMYHKLLKAKSVTYQDILDNVPKEQKAYDEGVEKGWTKEDGQYSPADKFELQELFWGKDNQEFEGKEF